MTRFIVLVPILASCSVGTYGESGDDGGGDDGPGVEDRNVCADRAAAPAPAYTHVSAPATTREGEGCLVLGCHLEGSTGAGAPAFAYAGTVYKDLAGTIPNPGVVVRLFPATGNAMKSSVAKAVTDAAGNFHIDASPNLTTFPFNTDVTACGADTVAQGIRPMVGAITKLEMNCNAGGTCHQAKPAKAATPVYLMD